MKNDIKKYILKSNGIAVYALIIIIILIIIAIAGIIIVLRIVSSNDVESKMAEIDELTKKACNTTNFSVILKNNGEYSGKVIYKDGIFMQEIYNAEYNSTFWSDTRSIEENNVIYSDENRFYVKNTLNITWNPEKFTILNVLKTYEYSGEKEYDGIECYLVSTPLDEVEKYGYKTTAYIDKNTGFVIRIETENNGLTNVSEREFSVGTVTDHDVAYPDLTGYTDRTVY